MGLRDTLGLPAGTSPCTLLGFRIRGFDVVKDTPEPRSAPGGLLICLPVDPVQDERDVHMEVQEETSCRGLGGVPQFSYLFFPQEWGIKGGWRRTPSKSSESRKVARAKRSLPVIGRHFPDSRREAFHTFLEQSAQSDTDHRCAVLLPLSSWCGTWPHSRCCVEVIADGY